MLYKNFMKKVSKIVVYFLTSCIALAAYQMYLFSKSITYTDDTVKYIPKYFTVFEVSKESVVVNGVLFFSLALLISLLLFLVDFVIKKYVFKKGHNDD